MPIQVLGVPDGQFTVGLAQLLSIARNTATTVAAVAVAIAIAIAAAAAAATAIAVAAAATAIVCATADDVRTQPALCHRTIKVAPRRAPLYPRSLV